MIRWWRRFRARWLKGRKAVAEDVEVDYLKRVRLWRPVATLHKLDCPAGRPRVNEEFPDDLKATAQKANPVLHAVPVRTSDCPCQADRRANRCGQSRRSGPFEPRG